RHTFSGYAVSQLRHIERNPNETYLKHKINGISKLKNLFKNKLITIEWLNNNFNKDIVDEVINNAL
ncbi:MAG: hypothetical protein WC389_21765, partial [Lutibacter sp.]